jgi:electron transfer flavoprotein alpha/beta subunit
MNITVCFKVIPKLEMMAESDWKTTSDNDVDTSFLIKNVNGFDESALEMGLRIKDKTETRLCALTIGDNISFIKNLYALKYDEVVRISNDLDLRFFPEVIASVIFSFIRKKGIDQDVIILGGQSSVGDNLKTPYLLGELLNIPCITEVLDLDSGEEEGTLVVKSLSDDGILTRLINTPCVIAVSNAPNCFLRVPTLAEKMKYKKKEVLEYSIDDFLLENIVQETKSNYCVKSLIKNNNTRTPDILDGTTMKNNTEILLKKYLKGKLK